MTPSRPPHPVPVRLRAPSVPLIAHKQVASVAREAAGELFESMMASNEIWQAWQEQNPGASRKDLERRFVSRFAPDCVPFARATLAHMLTLPGLDDDAKMCIHSALVLDSQLPGRTPRPMSTEIVNPERLR